jgi:hypothetical protein
MKRWLPFVWIVVPLAALVEMGHHVWVESRVPTDEDWKQAEAVIDEAHEPGDLVVISPWWASQGWTHLGRFMSVEQMAREDDTGYGRIWEVALAGHRNEEYSSAGTLLSRTRAGRLTVLLYRFPEAPTNIYDFVEALEEDASVSMIDPAGRAEPCPFRTHPRTGHVPGAAVQSGKFFCDQRLPWNNVAREVIADLTNRPRLCIWAHPVERKKVHVEYGSVPAGSVIVGHTGLKYEAARERVDRPPIIMEITAGGTRVGTVLHEHGGGWTPYRFELPAGWSGGHVTFEVHSQSVGMAHFCFSAKLRDK